MTEKIRLYQVWTKSKSNILPVGDPVRYMAYKEHRKILCKTIKLAKKSFYGRKFENFKADPRKTWGLINDLRGKGKTPPKSNFVIEGERINCRRVIANKVPDFMLVGGSFFLPKTQLVHGTNWWVYCPFSRKTVSTWY